MLANDILPKIPQYHFARASLMPPGAPFNLTFSVTNICQSRCKTCNIWEIYEKHPEKRQEELTLAEIEKIFQSMGHIYIFNVSGGEPFLRPDFVDIIEAACKYLTPGLIHIPTNAIAKKRVLGQTRRIIELLKTRYPSTRLTIKPSLDEITPDADQYRKAIRYFVLNTTAKVHSIRFPLVRHPGLDPGSSSLSGFLPSQE